VPEGHTLHLLAADLAADLLDRPVRVSSPQGRAASIASRLDGRVVTGTEAYGKHLFVDWDTGDVLHVHLGLYGRFERSPSPPAPPRTPNVRIRLTSIVATWDLTGPTACDLVDEAAREALLDRLGPDPLRADADREVAWARLRRRRSSIGAALMDQSLFAGVGNVFRAEVLFTHGIHPETPATAVTREEFDAMWRTLTRMLRLGMKERRIRTVPKAELPRRDDRRPTWVYRQELCRRCSTPVRRWDLAGRWSYACERCQPRP
jgi:endonuclease-8